jgi:hypothetical protein
VSAFSIMIPGELVQRLAFGQAVERIYFRDDHPDPNWWRRLGMPGGGLTGVVMSPSRSPARVA